MKKFLLSMIALVASFAASAAVVYFDNSTANWAAVSCYTYSEETMGGWPGTAMTQGEDGLWSVDVVEGCTKIIFNNAGKGAQTGNLDYKPGATYNEKGEVGAAEQHVYFKNTANWSAVYVYTWSPEYYGGWPGTQLTPNADGLYEVSYTAAPAGLKFHDNTGAGDTGDITEFSDGDIFGADGKKVDGDTPTPPTPGEDKDLYVIGNLCGWQLNDAVKMDHEEGTNVWTLTTEVMDGEEWKICDGTWGWSFGAGEGGTQPGVDNEVWFNSSNNFTGVTGATTITFTLVEGSDVEGSATPSILKYTGAAPVPTAPETLYILGDMVDNHWDPSNGVALVKDGNVFTGKVAFETAFDNDYGYFSFCTELSASSDNWNVGTRYGASEVDALIAAGETASFVKGTNSWMVLPGKYDVKVDFDASTVTLTADSSGIESVEVEAVEAAVYYNLQGVRVAAPEAGSLYIVKRGDKVSKEIVR